MLVVVMVVLSDCARKEQVLQLTESLQQQVASQADQSGIGTEEQ